MRYFGRGVLSSPAQESLCAGLLRGSPCQVPARRVQRTGRLPSNSLFEGEEIPPWRKANFGPLLRSSKCWGCWRQGRSKHWLKVKNRQHPTMSRVMEAFG